MKNKILSWIITVLQVALLVFIGYVISWQELPENTEQVPYMINKALYIISAELGIIFLQLLRRRKLV